MKKILILIVLLGSFLFFGIGKASAATYYVNNSGSSYIGTQGTYGIGSDTTGNGSLVTPWATMNKANNTALSGDTIYVAQGTYSETVTGNFWALIFKDGVNWIADGNVVVKESVGAANYSVISIAGTTSTTITGFTFDGFNQKSFVLYPQTNAANKTFVNCTFKNSVNYQINLASALNNTEFSFSGCTFNTAASSTKSNIQTYFPVTVTGSTFTSATGAAFLNSYSSSGVTTLTDNTFIVDYASSGTYINIGGTNSTYNIGSITSPNTFTITSAAGQIIYLGAATGNTVNVAGNIFNVYSTTAQTSLIHYGGASNTQGTSTVTYNTVNLLSSGSGGSGATNNFAFLYAGATAVYKFDWILDIEHNTLNINNKCATNSSGSSYLVFLKDISSAATINHNTYNIADTSDGNCEALWITSGIADNYLNGAHHFNYNTITTNTKVGHIIDVGYDGGLVYNHNISGVEIGNNSIISSEGNVHAILYAYADNGLIHHNYISGGDYGIALKGGSGGGANTFTTGKVYSNIIVNQRVSGVIIKGVKDVPIYNNVAWEVGAATHGALYIIAYDGNDSTGIVSKNNIFYTDTYSVYMDATSSLISDYNVLYANSGAYGYINGTTYSSWSSWQTAGYDAHSTNLDPLFVSSSNFHLQSTSPAIDAGVELQLGTDYEGTVVPQGRKPDIGAYEYPLGLWTRF